MSEERFLRQASDPGIAYDLTHEDAELERPGPHTYEIECRRCGATVTIDNGWANACERCGTEYNGAGQMLAPRRFWGEETGEHFS
jgi:hypothetical protein